MKHMCRLVLLATLITLPILCQARPNEEGVYEVLGVGTLSLLVAQGTSCVWLALVTHAENVRL